MISTGADSDVGWGTLTAITSVTTPAASGLELTGCDTGECGISLDVDGMDSLALDRLSSPDTVIVAEGTAERKSTLGDLATFTYERIIHLTDLADLADGDHFVVNDASAGSDQPRDINAGNVSNYIGARLAGTNLTYNTTTNQLDTIAGQIELIDSLNDVDYTQADTANLSTRFGGETVYTADIDAEGTDDAEINDIIVFQWRDNPAGLPADRQLGIRINDTGTTLPIRVVNPITRSLANKRVADLTRYEFLFLSRQDGVFIQLSALELASIVARDSCRLRRTIRLPDTTPARRHGWRKTCRLRSTGLSDTPAAITADECVMGNAAGDALEFGDCGTGGGLDDEALDFRLGTATAHLDVSWPLHANNGNSAGMAWDATNERVLVVDHVDDTVYRYERDGTYVDSFALNAANTAARGITTNDTHIFVVNITVGAAIVYRYQLDGTYVDNWTAQIDHTSPNAIAWDGSELNITQGTTDTVRRYTATGTHQGNWTLHADNDDARGMTWTGSQFLVTDHTNGLVYRYSGTHSFLGTWPQADANSDSDGMAFIDGAPHIVDEDNNVYKYAYGGVTSFQGLTDTPSDFGTAGQHVVVNAAADGLEFADAPAGGGGGILLQKYIASDTTEKGCQQLMLG